MSDPPNPADRDGLALLKHTKDLLWRAETGEREFRQAQRIHRRNTALRRSKQASPAPTDAKRSIRAAMLTPSPKMSPSSDCGRKIAPKIRTRFGAPEARRRSLRSPGRAGPHDLRAPAIGLRRFDCRAFSSYGLSRALRFQSLNTRLRVCRARASPALATICRALARLPFTRRPLPDPAERNEVRQEPMVRGLAAGASRIRTLGPSGPGQPLGPEGDLPPTHKFANGARFTWNFPFGKRFHRADGPGRFDGLRLSALLGLLRELTVVLEDTLAGERLFEPIQELRLNRLIVVIALWEYAHFMKVFGEPGAAGDLNLKLEASHGTDSSPTPRWSEPAWNSWSHHCFRSWPSRPRDDLDQSAGEPVLFLKGPTVRVGFIQRRGCERLSRSADDRSGSADFGSSGYRRTLQLKIAH